MAPKGTIKGERKYLEIQGFRHHVARYGTLWHLPPLGDNASTFSLVLTRVYVKWLRLGQQSEGRLCKEYRQAVEQMARDAQERRLKGNAEGGRGKSRQKIDATSEGDNEHRVEAQRAAIAGTNRQYIHTAQCRRPRQLLHNRGMPRHWYLTPLTRCLR